MRIDQKPQQAALLSRDGESEDIKESKESLLRLKDRVLVLVAV